MAPLRQAYEESGKRSDIGLTLAEVLLKLNRTEDAEAILKTIPLVDQDQQYQQLKAQLELKQEAAKTPEIQALEEQLNQDPDNLELAYELAVQFSQAQYHREALELLYGVLERDRNFKDGGARKVFVDILTALGKGDPLAVEFQRKFFTLLY